MEVIATSLPEVFIIEPSVFEDARGFFIETYNQERYQQAGIADDFVQDNFSHSQKGVLRGLHYQRNHPQAKLVSVTQGAVFDVAVDIRMGSPNFGKWFGVELTAENHRQLLIPKGFAHGFYVLSERVDFCYKCSDYYVPDDECGIMWNDPNIAIVWPDEAVILSDKDKVYPTLASLTAEQLPNYQGTV